MNAVILSFDPNEKQSVICEIIMKCMRAVESDSVKSAKLHKACERASETRERTLHGQEQNRIRMASMRESRGSVRFSNQHTSTITCTAVPRVWHFIAFYFSRAFSSCDIICESTPDSASPYFSRAEGTNKAT